MVLIGELCETLERVRSHLLTSDRVVKELPLDDSHIMIAVLNPPSRISLSYEGTKVITSSILRRTNGCEWRYRGIESGEGASDPIHLSSSGTGIRILVFHDRELFLITDSDGEDKRSYLSVRCCDNRINDTISD